MTWLKLRADIRSDRKGLMALAALVALLGTAVLGGLAAAHRTATALDRMIEETEAADVLVNPFDGTESRLTVDAIAGLDGVEQVGRADGAAIVLTGVADSPILDVLREFNERPPDFASDGGALFEFARPLVNAGRLPDVDDPHEVLVDATEADRLDIEVGDELGVRIIGPEELAVFYDGTRPGELAEIVADPAFGRAATLSVTGIGVVPDSLVVDENRAALGLLATPAFWERYDAPELGFWGAAVRLADGTDIDAFRGAVEALVPDEPISFQTLDATSVKVDRSTRPYVVTLLAFSAVAGALGLVVVAQAMSRRLRSRREEQSTLQGLGLTRASRFAPAYAWLACSVLLGCIGAVVGGWLVSPIAPIGPVERAEPHPGFAFDASVLLGAGLALTIVELVVAAIPAWRSTRARPTQHRRRTETFVDHAMTVAPSVPARTGLRFALRPMGERGTTLTSLFPAASAITLLVAVVVFAAGLDRTVSSGRLYGSSWDVEVDGLASDEEGPVIIRRVADHLETSADVKGWAGVRVTTAWIDGVAVPAAAFDTGDKSVDFTVVRGRVPSRRGEVALGRTTAQRLGLGVGDIADVDTADGSTGEIAVVGIAVVPAASLYPGADKSGLGDGAIVFGEDVGSLYPEYGFEGLASFYVVDLADGVEVDAFGASLPQPETGYVTVRSVTRPGDVIALDGLRGTPALLLGLLLVFVLAAVVHSIAVAIRERRRDLAVLQACGLTPRGVLATAASQATATVVVASLAGVPLGIVAGRLAWIGTADALGALADASVPLLALGLVLVAVIVLGNLVALVPGLRAAREVPATVLRVE